MFNEAFRVTLQWSQKGLKITINVLTGPYLFMHEWSKFVTLCKSKATDLVFTCNKIYDHHLYDLVIICSCNVIHFARVSKMQEGGWIILHATVHTTIFYWVGMTSWLASVPGSCNFKNLDKLLGNVLINRDYSWFTGV